MRCSARQVCASASWGAPQLAVVILTGIGNLAFRGLIPDLVRLSFWRSSFGEVLALKLLLVSAVVTASALHGRVARASPNRGGWLGRATLVLSVAVVVVAVFLVRGVPG